MANETLNDVGVRRLSRNTPLYFDSAADRRLFGWLHFPPVAAAASVGLVFCNPFGYEAICSHRASRLVAEAAALLGIPTLRFDYSGTGNSSDVAPEENQIDLWTQDICAAATEFKRITGVERICLMGFRLGAALALLAARDSDPVISGVIAIAPVVSGRKYFRELRMTRLASMLGAESSDAPKEQLEPEPVDGGAIEVSGFSLSAGTVGALPLLNLLDQNQLHCQQLLIVDDQSMPFSAGLAELAAAGGTQCRYETVPGVLSMLTTAPQFFTTPATLLTTISRWLIESLDVPPKSVQSPFNEHRLTGRLSDREAFASTLRPPDNSGINEQAFVFGADTRLFGIVTTPAAPEKRRRAVILLNAGADYHIGPNRMYVSLARRWARRGYTVLRMDFAGIGDSDTRPGRPYDEVFPPTALDDVRDAVSFVRSQYDIGDVTLAGLCSGAYHALRAAISGLPVSRVLLINPQNYFWKEGMTVKDMQLGELVRNPRIYRARAFTIESWKRLFTGNIDVSYITKILSNRLFLAVESRTRELARRLKIRPAERSGLGVGIGNQARCPRDIRFRARRTRY